MKQIEVESLPITLNYFMLLIKEIQTKFLTNHQLKELPKHYNYMVIIIMTRQNRL